MRYSLKSLVPFDEPKYVRNKWLQDVFNRYEDYYRPEMERMIRNQKFYWGINFGQWPAFVVEKLRLQGRRPPTYNIIAKKIESQIGSYLSNGFDIKYAGATGKFGNWAIDLQDMAMSDKSNLDWESSEIVALRDMHCMVGYERMVVSDRYDADFGNIAWEALPPTHIYVSPSWKTCYANDIQDYFEWGMFTVAEIMQLFPSAKDELTEWRHREEISGVNYGEYHGGPQRYGSTEEKWGDYHKVITYHSIHVKDRKWEYDLVNRCPFPDTGYEQGTSEDKQIKQAYMEKVGIGEGQYTMVRQKRKIKRIEAICPSLNNEFFLVAGKDRIQTNNVNLYPIGNSFFGQFRGMVDDLYDVQVDFNKGQMNIMDIEQRSAKGMVVLDLALAGGDDAKRREIEMQFNQPGARVWVEEGSTAELGPNSGIIDLKGHPPSPELFRTADQRLVLADQLSTMPAAMDSRTENANESGKLYQSKVQIGLISQKYGMKLYERHKREKMMAYPLQCKITYAGLPREFDRSDGSKLGINSPALDQSGNRVFINDIQSMPEMKVILVPSTNGVNIRAELRQQYTDTLQILNDPKDRLLKLIFIDGIFETQELSDEKKESIKKAIQMLMSNEAANLTLMQYGLMKQMQEMGLAGQGQQAPQQSVTGENGMDPNKAIEGTIQEEIPSGKGEQYEEVVR